jgi:hypothetical protein
LCANAVKTTPIITTPPAAQPAVQEPFGYLEIDDIESQREYPNNCRNVNLWHEGGEGMVAIYTTPPAAAVQEGRDWSLLEATQESLREHMSEIKRLKEAQPAVPLTDEMRKQMKERCDSMEMRGAFADGWLSAEAAHGITKGGAA